MSVKVLRGFCFFCACVKKSFANLISVTVITALIRARREHTYEIDTATLLLASDQWIPVEGVHELPLLQALINAGRYFFKPLRYDARTGHWGEGPAAHPLALRLVEIGHEGPLAGGTGELFQQLRRTEEVGRGVDRADRWAVAGARRRTSREGGLGHQGLRSDGGLAESLAVVCRAHQAGL